MTIFVRLRTLFGIINEKNTRQMKKNLSISGISAVFAAAALLISCNNPQAETAEPAAASVAEQGTIVYIDFDRILQEYDMANDLRSVVETKIESIQAEITRRGKKLEKDVNDFQEKVNKGLITRSTAEIQAQKLDQQQQEFNLYAQQKQEEINEEQVVMMNQLADAIKTFIDKYNAEKGYAMILTNQGGIPVITADASLNITDDVLAGLNEEYVKNKK